MGCACSVPQGRLGRASKSIELPPFEVDNSDDNDDQYSAWSVSDDGALAEAEAAVREAEDAEREAAATKLQCMFRGIHSRRRLEQKNLNAAERLMLAAAALAADEAMQNASAARLQARQRGRLARQRLALEEANKAERDEREAAATKLQCMFRGLNARRQMADASASQKLILAAQALAAEEAMQDAAAARLQARQRGRNARAALRVADAEKAAREAEEAERAAAATKLQAMFRGLTSRRQLENASSADKLALAVKAAAAEEALQNASAARLQARQRGRLARKALVEAEAEKARLDEAAKAAAVLVQKRIRGTLNRAATRSKFYSRPVGLPSATVDPKCEGWLVKRGSGFPFSWKRRYFVVVQVGSAVHVHYYEAAEPPSNGGPKPSNAPPPTLKGEYLLSDVRKAPLEPLGLLFSIAPIPGKGGGFLGGLLDGGGRAIKKRLSIFATGSGDEEGRELIARAKSASERDRWTTFMALWIEARQAASRLSSVRSSAPPGELEALLGLEGKGSRKGPAAASSAISLTIAEEAEAPPMDEAYTASAQRPASVTRSLSSGHGPSPALTREALSVPSLASKRDNSFSQTPSQFSGRI